MSRGRLCKVLDRYMSMVEGLDVFCDRCLETRRWGGSVVLMVVDAAFTSIGLNYFKSVVPKVFQFKESYVDTGLITSLRDLADADTEPLRVIWRNRRSWHVAKNVARRLLKFGDSDREMLRNWASSSELDGWSSDPIGSIKGVGLITYQYLRMMGGVDTVMPDKIVKRVLNEVFIEAGLDPVYDDIEFIYRVEEAARECGYRPIELCWMTWLIQEEGEKIRMEKYRDIMRLI